MISGLGTDIGVSDEHIRKFKLNDDIMPDFCDNVIEKEKLFYLWKRYDVKGRTFRQMVDQHDYIIDPQKNIGYEFFFCHFSDCYFYLNELSKAQATSLEEHKAILNLESVYKDKSRKFARTCVGVTFFSYSVFILATTSGIFTRLFALYVYYLFFNPIYDYGLLSSIFVYGPGCLKELLSLDETKSFSKIQTQMFIRYCAQTELRKALDYEKKKEYKPFKELMLVRIFRNNLKNFANAWKKRYYKLMNKVYKPKNM